MAVIKKKAWPEMFQKVLDGKKKFDIRLADVVCKPGDLFILEEWDPKAKKYTGRKLEKTVSFVMQTKDMKFWSQEEINKHGLQVIGFE